ncbi:MAG: hypothetical protein ACRCYA_04115 [Cetobacterium sp.]
MNSIKDSLTPVNQWEYQGFLTYDYKELEQSNPTEIGTKKFQLYGRSYLEMTGSNLPSSEQ